MLNSLKIFLAVFGANNQFQQQMTVAPPQPNFVSNQTMPVNHHYPAPAPPAASVPPKRERKPLAIVNPDTKEVVNAVATGDRENFIAHHTPERTTPQPVSCFCWFLKILLLCNKMF